MDGRDKPGCVARQRPLGLICRTMSQTGGSKLGSWHTDAMGRRSIKWELREVLRRDQASGVGQHCCPGRQRQVDRVGARAR